MDKLKAVLRMLDGKKTLIGSVVLSLLGTVTSLDALVHDGQTEWLTGIQYAGIGGIIAGLTGVSLRLSVGKAASGADLVKQVLEGFLQVASKSQDVNTTVDQLKKDA